MVWPHPDQYGYYSQPISITNLILGIEDYLCELDDQIIATLQSYCKTPSIVCDSYKNLADKLTIYYNVPGLFSALEPYFDLTVIIDNYW